MSSTKITRFDMDDSVFDGVAQENSIQEVLDNIDEMNANIDSIKEMINSGGSSADELVLASVLLRGDTDDYEWVLRQKGIGKVLNNVYELNSDELAFCETIEDIISSIETFNVIKTNNDCYNLCMKYNNTFANAAALFDYPDEMIIYQGNAYSTYSVGSKLNLLYEGGSKEFVVIAKDHFDSGKLLIAPSKQTEQCVWDSTSQSNNYLTSGTREYMNTIVLSKFSENVQNSITPTTIICHTSETATNSTTCTDKIVVLSFTELYGTSSNYKTQGTKIPYFSTNEIRASFSNGSSYYTRTPSSGMGPSVVGFQSNGDIIGTGLSASNYFFYAFQI